ncbi:hypothetical protein V8C86DRAFT_1829115 [Haematococcus lacustris]
MGGSNVSAARAHLGAVTGILPLPCGATWITAGSDSRLRLWDGLRWHNRLVTYAGVYNKGGRPRQLACFLDAACVFNPCGATIQVLDMWRGAEVARLVPDSEEAVNAVAWNGLRGHLYSAADDGRILVWGLP